MRKLCFIFLILLLLPFTAAGQGQQVVVDHDKVSIDVEAMRLADLLRLWDQATGMRSSVPAGLAGRAVTLQLSGLTANEAIRAIFQKLDVDYVFIEGQGIVVTGASVRATAREGPPAADGEAPEVTAEALREEEEVVEERQVEPRRQPKLIPTPFGPIPDSARNLLVHLPPVPGEVPPPPFFAPPLLPTPPAGAPNGPAENNLFAPISIYRNPALPPINSGP
jgi:hypothetical protein